MESEIKQRNLKRKRRMQRIRRAVRGSSSKPRLSVFKSNKHLFAQLIDDESSKTICGFGTMSKEVQEAGAKARSKEAAQILGKHLAQAAKKNKIERAVFDRSYYKYHGLIAEIANAAREEGLKF